MSSGENEVLIDDKYSGTLDRSILFKDKGMWAFPEAPAGLGVSRTFFRISSALFNFSLSCHSHRLTVRRNGYELDLDMKAYSSESSEWEFYLQWTPTYLGLRCRLPDPDGGYIKGHVATSPTVIPESIIEWARQKKYLPKPNCKSAESFYREISDGFLDLSRSIRNDNGYDQFWDIEYEGQTINRLRPKRELDIQQQLKFLLSYLEIQRGIAISPEYGGETGGLNFLFCGTSQEGDQVRVCVAFKKAHSKDLAIGLESQILEYMESRKTDYGIYVVLYFGPRFPPALSSFKVSKDEPKKLSLEDALARTIQKSGRKFLQYVILDLSPPNLE